MPRPPSVPPRRLIRVLERIGFMHVHGKGSHLVFAHADGRKTTVPMHGKDIPLGTLRAIIKDLHMMVGEFIKILKSL